MFKSWSELLCSCFSFLLFVRSLGEILSSGTLLPSTLSLCSSPYVTDQAWHLCGATGWIIRRRGSKVCVCIFMKSCNSLDGLWLASFEHNSWLRVTQSVDECGWSLRDEKLLFLCHITASLWETSTLRLSFEGNEKNYLKITRTNFLIGICLYLRTWISRV